MHADSAEIILHHFVLVLHHFALVSHHFVLVSHHSENVSRLKQLEYLNLALNNVERIENLEGL